MHGTGRNDGLRGLRYKNSIRPINEGKRVAKKFPIAPRNPHRICWGCDKYCPADSLACGNGSDRTQHPVELFGDDWHLWGLDAVPATASCAATAPAATEP